MGKELMPFHHQRLGLASVAVERRMFERAATLMGAAEQTSEAIGAPVYNERTRHERTLNATRSGMSPTHFAAALAAGKAMDLAKVAQYGRISTTVAIS